MINSEYQGSTSFNISVFKKVIKIDRFLLSIEDIQHKEIIYFL